VKLKTFLAAFILAFILSGKGFVTANSSQSLQPTLSATQLIKFEHITIQDGLSQSSVLTILQDRQGFLWLGTEDGLNRYDGYQFKILKPEPGDPTSLSNQWVTDLLEDPDGTIWVGTRLGGLNRYDPKTGIFQHYRHNPEDHSSLSTDYVRCLYRDSQGFLWIGTIKGLDRYNPETDAFDHYRYQPDRNDSLSNDYINSLLEDSFGNFWVGTANGLNLMDRQTGKFTHFRYDAQNPDSISGSDILSLYEDHRNILWIGTNNGLNRMDRESSLFTHFKPVLNDDLSLSNSAVLAIYEDQYDFLWVGTRNGLNLLDRETETFTKFFPEPQDPYSINDEGIMSFYEDDSGILWIGTFGGGVNKLDRNKLKFALLQHDPNDSNSLGDNSVFQLDADDKGNIWIATYGAGVDRLNLETGTFTHYRHQAGHIASVQSNFTWAVYADSQGIVWIGNEGGLDALQADTGEITHYRHNPQDPDSLVGYTVYYVLEDQAGGLWIGTENGLDLFDRQTEKFKHFRHDDSNPASLSDNEVVVLFESREGELWVGTFNGGLDLMDRQTGTFKHYAHNMVDPSSLGSNTILALTEDRSGTLWIGTMGGGLSKFDRNNGKFIQYTEIKGLPNNVVYAIIEDDQDYLWISTNDGVSRFDPQTEIFTNFDERHGLQSREFNMNSACQSPSGEIFFGGIQGISFFKPAEIIDNPHIPMLVITSLTQAGEQITSDQTVETLDEIILRWPHNYFEFEFAALDFSEPELNQYAYKLEKFDTNWVNLENRHYGRYTNLPGGTYTLQIKGSNNDRVWNETGVTLKVKVIPPIWNTLWFQGGVILLFGALLFTGYRLRVRSIESSKMQLEYLVEERTREIERLFEKTKELAVIEERNRLARDLHDSAKQKAFAALAQLGALRSILKKDPVRARNYVDEAEELVYEVIQELTFLIQEMYPLALKEKGLVTVLREYIYEWETRTDIPVSFQVSGERRLPLQIEQALYRIAQESLANVARHSQAKHARVDLVFNEHTVALTLEDDGCGFDVYKKQAGVGLRCMQERATMIHGELTIDSTPGAGTRIAVNTPEELPTEEIPSDAG
jgi:ligand-binding sensor domain-containing protein/signal transduction histidine kinase